MKSGKRCVILFIFCFLSVFRLWGINFQDINLSNDDRLIFKADFESYHAVFVSYLNNMSMRQLTAFPEKLYLADNGRTIYALSRFGGMTIPAEGGLPSPIPGYPSFAEGSLPLRGRLQDIAPSVDGRWVLFVEPISPGYGNLLLIDITNGAKRIVSEKVELPASEFPAKWSPDSRFFVYSKGGRLHYYPILANLSSQVDERFRIIGSGSINSVLWGHHGDFYYYTGNTLYRVINPELFTRTMYGDFLSIGNTIAVLPMEFDSNFDNYWIAPDSGSILINKNGRGFYFFMLGENQASPALPHIILPPGADNFNVLWSGSGFLTIVYTIRNETKAWRLEINKNFVSASEQLNVPFSAAGLLSPDETRAVFWGERGLELWNYTNWQLIQRFTDAKVYSCVWLNNRQIISGNSRFIEEINVSLPSYPRRRICLSGADEIGFEETRGISRILARSGTSWFATDGTNAWSSVSNVSLRAISFSTDRFRVFLEQQNQGYFKNIPMVRNLQSYGTVSLVSRHTSATNVFSAAGESGRQRQIALCFDLYDDDTGLTQVLAALRRFNIRATFFLNGEFIRRNPNATKTIADAGHETASLFYAPIDLSDTRYRITAAFISQGLARNEDEFNRVTGRELSMLWHPPFYRTSALINSAAAAAGYFTADRTFDPGDWLSREDALRLNLRQISPSEMIEQIILNRRGGEIVPVRIGLLPGGRDEYLFQRIEVLLDAFVRSGFEVVPVSAVISR